MKFRDDFGVYLCSHVFKENFPVLEGIRDPDGDWQFLCGGEHDFANEEPHLVGVGHLTSRDKSIHELTGLERSERAVRASASETWVISTLDE